MEYAADDRTDDALSTVNGIESNNLLVVNVKNKNDERCGRIYEDPYRYGLFDFVKVLDG